MLLPISIIVLVCLLAVIVYFRHELAPLAGEYDQKWLLRSAVRGVAIPILVWVAMNWGTVPLMPPLTLKLAASRNAGHWIVALASQASFGALAIGSCWASLTCAWFMAALFRHAHNRDDLIIATLFWSVLAIPVMWSLTYAAGWSGSGFVAFFWLCPLTAYLLNHARIFKPLPTYSRAIGKMKSGKYGEAEIAILSQLEKCETDFDGWMMLADLYAHQFKDLTQAQQTILDVCAEPATTVSQISIALHRLADWQLNLRGDTAAARLVLEDLCNRMPGTHLARMAQHRLNQLPATDAEWAEQQKHRTFNMPAPELPLDAGSESDALPLNREEATLAANQLVEQLSINPKDMAAREQLARIFEGPLEKLDLALEQLDLLAGMPEAPPTKATEWLALMAAWEIKHRGETETAKEILRRLIHEHPQSAQAFAAQKRLNLMRSFVKGGGKPITQDNEAKSGG